MLCFLNDGSLNMPGSELSWSLLTVLTEPITWCLRLRFVLYMFSLIVRLEYGNHTMKYHEIPHKIKMPCFTNDRPWNAIMKYRNIHMRVSENASVESHMPASVRFGRPILLSHLQDPGIPMSSISGTCPKSMGRSPTFFLKFLPTTICLEAKIESRCWNPKNCERSLSYHLRSHPGPPFYGCKIWCFWNIRDFCVFSRRYLDV